MAGPAAPSGSTRSPLADRPPADVVKALAEHRSNNRPGDGATHMPTGSIRQRQARAALFAATTPPTSPHRRYASWPHDTAFTAEPVQTALTAAAPHLRIRRARPS
jgi:hypothetical protein